MGYFTGWTWQKWLGKLSVPIVTLIGVTIWEFAEVDAPTWAPIVAGAITFIVQQVLALFPAKTT